MFLKIINILSLLIISTCFILCNRDNPSIVEKDQYRIISLSPHITEIIYALGAERYLIASTDFCNYPQQAQKTEKIGGLLDPNIEKMIALKPTHLFGVPAHQKLNEELKKFDLTIHMLHNEEISDVFATIDQIGRQIGYQKQAERLVDQIQATFDSLKNVHSVVRKTGAMLVIGRERGTLRNIMVAGKATFLDEVWQLVGGKNCYRDLPARYATINLESILAKDPDVIIEFDTDRPRGIYKSEMIEQWSVLKDVKAVKLGNLYMVGGGHSMIPGPRMVQLAADFQTIMRQVRLIDSK